MKIAVVVVDDDVVWVIAVDLSRQDTGRGCETVDLVALSRATTKSKRCSCSCDLPF
jgi:hypothetical protein